MEPAFFKDPYDEKKKQNFASSFSQKEKTLEGKVAEIVLGKISKQEGSLFVSAIHPSIVFEKALERPLVKKGSKKKPIHYEFSIKQFLFKVPIGIYCQTDSNWINATMQFIIFTPCLRKIFDYISKDLSFFTEFIDQYILDALDNKTVTLGNALSLIKNLERMFSQEKWFGNPTWAIPVDFLRSMIAFVLENDPNKYFPIFYDIKHFFENDLCTDSFSHSHSEFFLFQKSLDEKKFEVKKQIFISNFYYYELDSFIEYKSDGREKGTYIAYIKRNGKWYQCEDHRVVSLMSINLSTALKRVILCHYRQVQLTNSER